MRFVEAGFVVLRPTGREPIVADFFAIDRKFVLAEATDVHEGAAESGSNRKFAAQHDRGKVCVGGGDPFCMPIGFTENAHGPARRLAPA